MTRIYFLANSTVFFKTMIRLLGLYSIDFVISFKFKGLGRKYGFLYNFYCDLYNSQCRGHS